MTEKNESIINTSAIVLTMIVSMFIIIGSLGGFVWYFSDKVVGVKTELLQVMEEIKKQVNGNTTEIKIINTKLELDKNK